MLVEVSLENMIKVGNLVSLGKALGGLVHNLNGPLQNLSMEMEMMGNVHKCWHAPDFTIVDSPWGARTG